MEPVAISGLPRIRGWLLIVIGVGLSLGMLWLGAFLAWTIAHNDQPGHSHWRGSPQFTVQVFELFAVIFLFGIGAMAGGCFQLRKGRPSWPILGVLLVLVAVMCFLGWQIVTAPG